MDIDITKIEPNSVYIICPSENAPSWTIEQAVELANTLSTSLKPINSDAVIFRDHIRIAKKE